MYQLFLIISIIVCVLLVLIVLIQNPKGGGLSSNFSSSSQLMGVQKTGDFLEKGTWILAITLMVLSLAINVATKGGTEKSVNSHADAVKSASKPGANAAQSSVLPGLGQSTGQPATQQPKPQPSAPPKK
jgi:preprotein translocase subunit SecG